MGGNWGARRNELTIKNNASQGARHYYCSKSDMIGSRRYN